MKEKLLLTAGYCGLACKACSVYIASCKGGEMLENRAAKAGVTAEEMFCKGCRSDKTSPYCTECNIKNCIKQRNINWCSECAEYPCKMINDFKNSMPHRYEINESLEFAKCHSIDEWDKEMEKSFTCKKCGTYNSVYARECSSCGNEWVNEFAIRHWDVIKDSSERRIL